MKLQDYRRLSIALCLITLGCCLGCGSGSPEQGSGVATSEERQLDYFDKVNASGLGKVIIRFGNTNRCTVRTDDNLIDSYETRTDGGTLFLGPTSFMSPRSGITTTIETDQSVTSVELSGACQVVLQRFSGDELTISAKDASELSAVGNTKKLIIDVEGSTEIDLFKLKATDIEIQADGNSRINVHAKGTLEVIANGAVIVAYEGDAEVSQALTGVSKIKKQ